MQLAFQCVGSLILLQLLLAVNVSRVRVSTGKIGGCNTEPGDPLHKARVAHSNACEYIPALCLLILCLSAMGLGPNFGWAFKGAVVARVLHVVGTLTGQLDKPNPFRGLGALGTFLLGIGMAAGLLWHVL